MLFLFKGVGYCKCCVGVKTLGVETCSDSLLYSIQEKKLRNSEEKGISFFKTYFFFIFSVFVIPMCSCSDGNYRNCCINCLVHYNYNKWSSLVLISLLQRWLSYSFHYVTSSLVSSCAKVAPIPLVILIRLLGNSLSHPVSKKPLPAPP